MKSLPISKVNAVVFYIASRSVSLFNAYVSAI
jgi:hypothetical protein